MKRARPQFRTEFIYTTYPWPHQVSWYKWEFLRRNTEYHADYRKFIELFGAWFDKNGYWYDLEKREKCWGRRGEEYFYFRIFPEISRLCHKWEIGNLFPPHWKFSRRTSFRKVAKTREMLPPTSIAPELNWDLEHMSDLIEKGFTGTADSAYRYGNLVRIEFDLNRPLKDLLKYASYVLGRAMNNYSDEARELGLKTPRGRRRLADYDLHLRVWDLNEKGTPLTKIVESLPGVNSVQSIHDHLRAARRLIAGGYKEIR